MCVQHADSQKIDNVIIYTYLKCNVPSCTHPRSKADACKIELFVPVACSCRRLHRQ